MSTLPMTLDPEIEKLVREAANQIIDTGSVPSSNRELYDAMLLGRRYKLSFPSRESAQQVRSTLATIHSRNEKKMKELGETIGLSLIFTLDKNSSAPYTYDISLSARKKLIPAWTILSSGSGSEG